jgi:C-3',4' desaturase CrtD
MTRRGDAFDAIVIGAGLAGAVAGAWIAAAGRRVAVLETDAHAGGCAANFQRGGYAFAVGATVGMGLEPGGVVHHVAQRVGFTPRYRHVDPAIRVLVGDRRIDIHADRAAFAAELDRAFPGDPRPRRAFWRDVATLARGLDHAAKRFPVMPFAHPRDLLDTARAAHPALLPVLRHLRSTVADLLGRHGVDDPLHRAFVDGQLIDAMQVDAAGCAAPNGAMALDVYRRGAQVPMGGLQAIAEGFLQVVRRRGEVRFATRARAILRDDHGHVAGVTTRHGDLRAPVVIAAIPLPNVAALLADDTILQRRVAALGEMWGAFTLYLGVHERALPRDVAPFLQVTDLDTLHDGGNVLISVSPADDTSRAPALRRAITVSTHVHAASWLALAETPQAYQAAKDALTERVLRQVERLLPDVRSGIEILEAGTPRTFLRYTRRAGGAVGGFAQTPDRANFGAPSHRTAIPGLFLAGDTVFPGQGLLGVTVSGHNAARSALRHLQPLFASRHDRRAVETQEVAA